VRVRQWFHGSFLNHIQSQIHGTQCIVSSVCWNLNARVSCIPWVVCNWSYIRAGEIDSKIDSGKLFRKWKFN
jgi:hypothetical protein